MPANKYEKRRDFSRTGEPHGGTKKPLKKPIFVVQRHDARSLHHDFRLEVDGTLKSWAVPKGPSTNPDDKRLAVPTEDHPLDYANFEGTIPEGEYGAGTVLIWDRGTYENITVKDGETIPMAKALESGHALFRLNGEKVNGGYALHRIRSGKKPHWLLIKMDDEEVDARRNPVSSEPKSVVSGRSIAEIAGEEGKGS